MTPDAKLRMDVYQEGQRAFSSGAICPYTDWRAKTWEKGRAESKEWYALNKQSESLEAIEKQEQGEPVAWRAPNWGHSADEYVYRDFDDPVIGIDGKPSPNNEPLYTTTQQRKPLTDEQRREIAARWRDGNGTASEIIDMVEAAHGIKE